jgi:hypothetical protein
MLRLRHPVSLLLICILVLFGVLRSFSTPAPRAADVPDVVFSAFRADAILRDLLQENLPHVSGSLYNLVVRNRLLAHLESAGYETEIQSRFHCNAYFGSCSPVDNVIAVKPGTVGKNAVLLTAHYDSGWTGPGAADDGAGTAAILEIARMAADFPPFENDIVFLFSDSEENGLIGADAFAEFHPLFAKVKAVINLEARGVTGPSAMFETNDGNRRIIRLLARNLDRPVANSLTYEIYKRMSNDTDYSVYKRKGVMGINFAFSKGVAAYHSVVDDPDHLDLGSLQHHGDNAWGMLKALADRNIDNITAKEDAGYIDIFGMRLAHYPESIALGLSLVLGVWVLLAIVLAFRKDFRIWQLRWGLVVVPWLIAAILLGGLLLSFPLGHWADLHPIEHPLPWMGRLTLFLMIALVLYTTLRLFSNRVSPCAMMMLSWGLIFVLGMVLASKLPTASHLTLIPLAMFMLGSLVDMFRKKSRAPLLLSTLLGFAATVFISLYHFFMLEVVLNFDRSHLKVIPLILMSLTILPMLLAFVKDRELSWQPARWLLVAILVTSFIHLSLPGFTPERPRGMSLIYHEVEGSDSAYVVLESYFGMHDHQYASGHGFELTELDTGWPELKEHPAREVPRLNLPGVKVTATQTQPEGDAWRHRIELQLPDRTSFLQLVIPREKQLRQAWVDGQLALDMNLESKMNLPADFLRLIYPPATTVVIELLTASKDAFTIPAITWHDLPGVLTSPFMGNWPDEAQPLIYGPRAQKVQKITIGQAIP